MPTDIHLVASAIIATAMASVIVMHFASFIYDRNHR